jgi:hypothetical protein
MGLIEEYAKVAHSDILCLIYLDEIITKWQKEDNRNPTFQK